MTGPEHYRYAEQLLDMAGDDELGSDAERYRIAKAQVHATLGLAAALAAARLGEMPAWDADAWYSAAVTPNPGTPADGGQ